MPLSQSKLNTFSLIIKIATQWKCDMDCLWKLIGEDDPENETLSEPELLTKACQNACKEKAWNPSNPTTNKETWLGLVKWAAWNNLRDLTQNLVRTRPNGPLQPNESKLLIKLAGGNFDTPGLRQLVEQTNPGNWKKKFEEATLWKETNLETHENRLREIKKIHPDYDPKSKKWGEYLLKEMKTEGIDLKKTIGTTRASKRIDPTITIVGESHSHPKTAGFLFKTLESAIKKGVGILTIEEPRDASWRALSIFLMNTEKGWDGKQFLAAAKELVGDNDAATRLAILALAKSNGLKIAFVDIPSNEKAKQNQNEIQRRRYRVAHGEPFDPNRPVTTEGGSRCLATTLLHSYRTAKKRSDEMANAIHQLQMKEGGNKSLPKILHIGGALHAEDIANRLQKIRPTRGRPVIEMGPLPSNPLLHALGKTKEWQNPEKSRKKPSHPEPEM